VIKNAFSGNVSEKMRSPSQHAAPVFSRQKISAHAVDAEQIVHACNGLPHLPPLLIARRNLLIARSSMSPNRSRDAKFSKLGRSR